MECWHRSRGGSETADAGPLPRWCARQDRSRSLTELASFDPRQREVVELKYFAGLTIAEIATALGISAATVEREWATAKAWLFHRLSGR